MLKGTLDDFTLPDVFRLLSTTQKTGLLEIERSAGAGKVYFRDGEVYYADSSLTRDPLGQKLVRSRLITEVQLHKALDEQAENSKRLGEILVSQGVIEQEQVENALRQQIEDAVFDLLRWELGEFGWSPAVEIDPEVSISVSVENLIMEASRKLEELEVISKKIPDESAVLAMAPTPPDGAAEINITPEEWRILVLVNGTRKVSDIADEVGLDNFSALRTLFGLASAGLIEVLDIEPSAALAELASGLAAEEEAASEPEAEVEVASVEVAVDEPDLASEEEQDDRADVAEAEEIAGVEEIPETVSATLTETPDNDDPLAGELLSDEAFVPPTAVEAESSDTEAASELELPEEEIEVIPVTADPQGSMGEEPIVDRLAAVKELADLFDQTSDSDSEGAGPPYPAEIEAALAAERAELDEEDQPRRVEDDEEITKGLITRLIDGVKGL